MSIAGLYYLISVVGSVGTFLSYAIFTSGVVTFFSGFGCFADDEDDASKAKYVFKRSFAILVVVGLLNAAIPAKKDMMIIAGLHIGEKGMEKVIEEAGEFYPLLKDIIKKELVQIAGKTIENAKEAVNRTESKESQKAGQ